MLLLFPFSLNHVQCLLARILFPHCSLFVNLRPFLVPSTVSVLSRQSYPTTNGIPPSFLKIFPACSLPVPWTQVLTFTSTTFISQFHIYVDHFFLLFLPPPQECVYEDHRRPSLRHILIKSGEWLTRLPSDLSVFALNSPEIRGICSHTRILGGILIHGAHDLHTDQEAFLSTEPSPNFCIMTLG